MLSSLSVLVIILSIILCCGCAQKKQEIPPWLTKSDKEEIAEPKETAVAEISKALAEEIVMVQEKLVRNPFLTEEEERRAADLGNITTLDYLKPSAILYNPSLRKSKVIINGRILELGGNIDSKEIIEIQPDAVILKDAQGSYIIKLKKISGA